MKNILLVILIFIATACASQQMALPSPAKTQVTQAPATELIIPTEPNAGQKIYANSLFGLGFQFPTDWFGPEEYISENDLRVEIGSDKVYPYGTDPAERIYELKNSYNIVIQYSNSNQNDYMANPVYQALLNLQDGESFSDARSQLIRVRQLDIGRFKGFEYIETASENTQTSRFYSRSAMLFDEQTNNILTIMGQPINVEVSKGTEWQDVYRTIDEANLAAFYAVVESIIVNTTGLPELDKIMVAALTGKTEELKSLIRFTQIKCTFVEGLGGPPKCMEGETEGSIVEVLPILDSEGHFLRKAELESWNGLDVSELFAVYEISELAYSDENYPVGQYAIVFIREDKRTTLTLQVDQGNIIRVDYGFEYPPSIPVENVTRYLIEPNQISP